MKRKLVTVDAETLLATPMSKTMFIVDGLIPQGVNVLSGAAKIGKSWLMLWLELQVSQGFSVWRSPTMHCDMLYLCLEDTLRRIKDRLFDLTDDSNRSFHLAVTCGLNGNGLEEEIMNFLEAFPKTKLVIIDTLQKVRDSRGSAGKTGMYGNDYDDISAIKRIADERDISIILVHHLRKLKDGDDPFNEVSGSTGITGAADTNYVLKRKRSSRDATLLACGRDVQYQELALRFQDLKWELVERKNTEEIRKAEIPQFLFRVAEFMKDWCCTIILDNSASRIYKKKRNGGNKMTQKKAYDNEFKVQAVKLGREIGFSKAARELGVNTDTLYGWNRLAKDARLDLGAGSQTPDTAMSLTEEVQKLRQQNREQAKQIARLKEENEFLAEASAFFAASRRKSAKT